MQGRQTHAEDFAEAQALINDRFLYDVDQLAALRELWQQIIDNEWGFSSVVTSGTQSPLLAFGISVMLKAEFMDSLSEDPQPFIASRVLEAWQRGKSPIMTRDEIAEANAGWGVDVFVLHHGYAPMKSETENYGVIVALAAEFFRDHAGLNLRSLTNEFYDRWWLDINARFGFVMRGDFLDHPAAVHVPAHRRPFVCGIRRSEVLAQDRGDFPLNALFTHFPPPRLGLDFEQRRFARRALRDESDGSMDDHWASISDRICAVDTSILASGELEQRARIIEWLRSHPEELQPYAMPGVKQSK